MSKSKFCSIIGFSTFEINLLQTKKVFECSKNNSNINFDIFTYFLRLKMWILTYLQNDQIVDKLTKTLLFNEKVIPKFQLTLFKQVGLYHLIVISGMHIVILMKIVRNLLRLLKISTNNQKYILIIICTIYLLLIKVTFPVLFQILKLCIEELKVNENLKLVICMLLMIVINYDNFNYYSFVLTICIQIILINFKNFDIALINISLFTNLLLFKFNNYFNLFTLVFTPILIWFFEKILFKLVLFNFIFFKIFDQVVIVVYSLFLKSCEFANKNLNILIHDWRIINILIVLILILNIIYLRYYEN